MNSSFTSKFPIKIETSWVFEPSQSLAYRSDFLADKGGGGGRVAMIIIDRLVFNVNKIYVLSPVWRELLGGSVVSSKSVNS